MRLRDKNILVISPERWDGLHMSKHHVSQGLVARGNRVWFWGPTPPGTRRVRLERNAFVTKVFAPHWLKGVNRAPLWLNKWYYKERINRIAEAAGVRFDIIWCFDTSRLQAFPDVPGLRLLHLVDYDILYSGHGLMRSADLIVTTADAINDKVRTIAPQARVHKVGHALDARWLHGSAELSAPRSDVPRTCVYAGQFFNTYIDWDALLATAEAHPGISFQYVGNVDHDFPSDPFQRLRRLPNVSFTGLKTKDELVPIVRGADILIFCFMTDKKMLERANPHKVLEYLSTGNVIVGSWTLEYEGHQHLLIMTPDRAGFVPAFQQAVDHFAALNAREKRAERIAFASERTIDHLLDHVELLLADAHTSRTS